MFYSDVSTGFILGCYEFVNSLESHDVHIHFIYEAYVSKIGLMMAR
jgi:hypothetical protein